MNRLFVVAFLALGFIPGTSSALEIKGIRLCFGLGGATRQKTAFLPGDVIWLTFDVRGLEKDAKTSKFSYETVLEVLDANGKVLFKDAPAESNPVAMLGGTSFPGQAFLQLGAKQTPGKYTVRISVKDKVGKTGQGFDFPYVVLPEDFGLIGVMAPAVHLVGQQHIPTFALVNMTLDKKQAPNVEVAIRILDDKGAKLSDAKMLLPRDMPEGTDLGKQNLVPITYPVYLNRPGRFTVEVTATDKAGNKKVELSYPITVLDVSTFTGK